MASKYKNFIYDEAHGFVFAYVPKVACTNWKALLRYMAGHADWLDNKLAHDKVHGGLRYLDFGGSDAALLNDPSIRKYAMVRDPYSRILSAYLNKVENRLPVKLKTEGEDHFQMVVREIDRFRREKLGGDNFPEITFETFLRWLKEGTSPFTRDEHWALQSILLRQPEVVFDDIGRFEALSRDAPRILCAMGCDQNFPSQKDVNFAPTDARSKVEQYFDPVTYELVNEIFAGDFDSFGYAPRQTHDHLPRAPETKDSAMYFSASPTRPVPSMKGRAYPSRQPVKHDGLAILRDLEIPVATVIDVGAQFVTEELIEAYPDRPHLLIEPVAEYHAALKTRYTREGIDHVIAPVAVAERDGESDLVVQSVGGGGTVTHSRLVDERVPGADQRTRRVPMRRLDTLVAELGLAPPFLVKIDVDGGELRVLRGAPETLKRTNVVVIEAQIRNVVERSTPLVEAGFELFDIVDLCYHDHRLSQMDLVFVKKSLLEAEGKTIFANGFNPKAWFKLKSRS